MKLFANWNRMFAAVIASMLFVGVATAQQNPYDKFRTKERTNKGYLSEEDEMKMGEQVHQELLKQIRLVDDRALNDYVNRLGQNLARRSERPNIPWKFYVVNDKTINAFATLGGRVYIHTGLMAATTSEAQLASVIGHEIGHIVGRHGLENVKRAGSMKTQGTVIGATILGAILGGQQGAEAGMALGSMVAGGFLMKHSREAEREADFLGLYNLKSVGYNTGGMIEMFQMLQQASKGGGSGLGSIMASHPDPREREANTRTEINAYLKGTDTKGISNTTEFQRLKSGLPAAPATSAPARKTRPRP
ncbi:MAG: M48 family metallopeptidase [Blastocatellia bacterium]